jgi:heme/copper-type cytochrome/quinol oxidase subunit 2
MFDSFEDFFWTFMAMSGFMFWICVVIFVGMVIKRNRAKRKAYYE